MKLKTIDRREFLRRIAMTSAILATGLHTSAVRGKARPPMRGAGKKVIVLGFDGMDPLLCNKLIAQGKLLNFEKLKKLGGYSPLGTSLPPQSPVAWSNVTIGANPGKHGIFSFVQRYPEDQIRLFTSIAQTIPGKGIAFGNYVLPVLKRTKTVIGRQGKPFWDHLDKAGINSAIYMMPSNYPPSESKHGNHRSLSGMGTPDLLGTLTTYQYFAEDGPALPQEKAGGWHSKLVFENDSAEAQLIGPRNMFLKKPESSKIDMVVYRDRRTQSAIIEIQGQSIMLKEKQWSDWVRVEFELKTPFFMPDEHVKGICRILLQGVSPAFKLYISPLSIDPTDPVMKISEPDNFAGKIAKELGPFYTVGFAEEFKARKNKVFSDTEYAEQCEMVLHERLKMLDYALKHYDDGMLFFYFSSTDLQSHMFWWDTDAKNPVRSSFEAKKYHNHIKKLYQRMDKIMGSVLERYGDKAAILVLSDHGFSHFRRFFSINTWLRENGYIQPSHAAALNPNPDLVAKTGNWSAGVNWSQTKAYGIGVNGLYLNLEGRERFGIVDAKEKEALMQELITKLEALKDEHGDRVIRKVYRADEYYSGNAMKYAPDLIIGCYRGFRIPGMDGEVTIPNTVFEDNENAWAADHCIDPREVPGVLFCNKPIKLSNPSLIDIAPTILEEFSLEKPSVMEGKNIFKA